MLKSKYYKKNTSKGSHEALIYSADAILNEIKKSGSSIIAITSTVNDKTPKDIAQDIAFQISKQQKKVAVVDIYPSEISDEDKSYRESDDNFLVTAISDSDIKDLSGILAKFKDKYDIIIINLAPVRLFAKSLQVAQEVGSVFLIERYLYTKYYDYEETLDLLKQYSVEISGVITYR